jgi:hypothetical protein
MPLCTATVVPSHACLLKYNCGTLVHAANTCRGAVNELHIEDTDIGELTAITIGHDSSGNSSSWHLSHVEVTPLPPNPSSNQNPGFSCSGGTSSSCSSPKGTLNSQLRSSMGRSSQQGSLGLLASGSMAQRTSALGSPGGGAGFAAAAAAGASARAGVTYLFPCDAWLDERLGDGKTERRLESAR